MIEILYTKKCLVTMLLVLYCTAYCLCYGGINSIPLNIVLIKVGTVKRYNKTFGSYKIDIIAGPL